MQYILIFDQIFKHYAYLNSPHHSIASFNLQQSVWMRTAHYLVLQTVLQVISIFNSWLWLNSKNCLVLLRTLSFHVSWSLYLRGWAMMLSFTHPFWALCKTMVVWSSTQFFHLSILPFQQVNRPQAHFALRPDIVPIFYDCII